MFEVYVFLHEDDEVPFKIVSDFESEAEAVAWVAADIDLVYEIHEKK